MTTTIISQMMTMDLMEGPLNLISEKGYIYAMLAVASTSIYLQKQTSLRLLPKLLYNCTTFSSKY